MTDGPAYDYYTDDDYQDSAVTRSAVLTALAEAQALSVLHTEENSQ